MNFILSRGRFTVFSLFLVATLSLPSAFAQSRPVVSVRADPARTSEPLSDALFPPGKFIVSRSGSRDLELKVALAYEGTASKEDYEALPETVVIPAGAEAATVLVTAKGDRLVEGTETGVAILRASGPDASGSTALPYDINPEHPRATVEIADVPPPPDVPVVGVRSDPSVTREPIPNALIAPGRFIVSRSGGRDFPLDVYLGYAGTASAADYEPLPAKVTIPAGKEAVDFLVVAKSDDLVEGTETVIAQIRPVLGLPTDPAVRPYDINPEHAEAKVEIADEDKANTIPVVSVVARPTETTEPAPYIRIVPGAFVFERTGPAENELRIWIEVEGTATPERDYTPLDHWVVFPKGEHSATVQVVPLDDDLVEPDETVVVHITQSPLAGPVALYNIDPEHGSARVIIHDSDRPSEARLEITRPAAGTVFPVGKAIEIKAVAVDPNGYIPRVEFYADDKLIGVSEIAFLVPPPDGTPIEHTVVWSGAAAGPHILTARAATADGQRILSGPVPIRVGDGPAEAAIRITQPQDGDTFPVGRPIEIHAVAVDPHGYIPRVVFYADDQRIGVSEIAFLVPPPDGTPVEHSLIWSNAPAGAHLLTARSANGQQVLSNPVSIRVGDGPGEAAITITAPHDGEHFPAGEPIQIEAVAKDPKGYIPRLEFYAGDRLIGVSEIVFIRAPDPGTPIHHQIVWTNPPPGEFKLTARGVDATGARVTSPPVLIVVSEVNVPRQVVLAISAPDPIAREGTDDTARFVIARVGGPVDVEVQVELEIGGTAQNGVDYSELPRHFLLPAGKEAFELLVKAVPDKALEGEESVVIKLLPPVCPAIFPPPPQCYLIAPDRGSARAVILDAGAGENRPPLVGVASPKNGQVFALGQRIEVSAKAGDPDGTIKLLELLIDDDVFARTERDSIVTVWTNPPAGPHTITARATDDDGAVSLSDPVKILVRAPEGFVSRVLPDGFAPGVAFTVTLRAVPPRGSSAWAVEDHPPTGWPVTEISHEGVFDAATGKVKFGPFLDAEDRALTYRVTPPGSAVRGEFSGVASVNGENYRITGDQIIQGVLRTHPADSNADFRLVLNELTAYAALWKSGSSPTVPVEISYVTRAGFIWRHGEAYVYDPSAGPAPLCWLPVNGGGNDGARALSILSVSTATRTLEGLNVTIHVELAPGVSASAVEETLPPGWSAANISVDGTFDPATGTIRWGLFLDTDSRALTYTLVPPSDATVDANGILRGSLSTDGLNRPILGAIYNEATGRSAELRLPRCERMGDGSVRLQLQGAAGQTCRIEVSDDLIHWKAMADVFLPEGELEFNDEGGNPGAKFYRLRAQ